MLSKVTSRIPVGPGSSQADVYVPYGVLTGSTGGPRVAIVAGAHGTEVASQDAVLQLWRELTPQDISGTLIVVFVANVAAAEAGIPVVHPGDGRNLNRVWPGDVHGSVSERIAHVLWQQLLSPADVVIDMHGGEWTEAVDAFGVVHHTGNSQLDARSKALGCAIGLPYLEVTDADDKASKSGSLSVQVAKAGRVGMVIEVGGCGRRDPGQTRRGQRLLKCALEATGMLSGDGRTGREATTVLGGSEAIYAPVTGLLSQRGQPGQILAAGETLCNLSDFDGELLQNISVSRSGVLLLASTARVVAKGHLVAKVGLLAPDVTGAARAV